MVPFSAFSLTNFLLLYLSGLILVRSEKLSFSVDLIHRDSPASPFYDASLTPSQQVASALQRSITRAWYFRRARSGVATVFPNSHEADYLMRIMIGTPPQEIVAVADTGSDIIWTQCQPCSSCYQQNLPIYSPIISSTYRALSCGSRQCNSMLPFSSCIYSRGSYNCQYFVMYEDMSYSTGDVATETITLGSVFGRPILFPNTVFGCGHNNTHNNTDVKFSDDQSGVVGLSQGPNSLISQMGASINGKFSYCLVPFTSRPETSSRMYFGELATVSGRGVVSTPIIRGEQDTLYNLQLHGITVGHRKVDFYLTRTPSSQEGNIIIDSGTSLTLLPPEFYHRVELAVRSSVRDARPISPDVGHNLSLCYNANDLIDLPGMVMHFKGADVKLDPMNAFVQVSEDSICLAFAPADGVAVFGNLAQVNFLVGYDIYRGTVSFRRTDCTQR